ncbi:RadC family protein [Synoicihabitans lomoniglobus]|uniref:DNA repair protein RadC n=1 Tax=Synoicihabitans lomoniglobus TaxID=2909285 RepID=A0AAF0CRU8_9BACT|nr:DNA repair protein RadC [Opitutaceae bacterium LMO-M01]WED66938.1 DNA repair protein RadC [Opitutaceae bacterium LMO-M01]
MAELESSSNRLLSLAANERPQERLERQGPSVLSDGELLAMLLRSGTSGRDVLTVAQGLIANAGSLAGLTRWTLKDFTRHKGVGHVKALQLLTVMEIARRVVLSENALPPVLENPQSIAEFCRPHAMGLAVEKFWVLSLNRKNRLIRRTEVTSGTAGSTLVHPREVFREAIKEAASAVVCVHNHPSGDPAPSAADIRVTRVLREAAQTIQIDLLDHIIIGSPAADPVGLGHYSFRDAGVL